MTTDYKVKYKKLVKETIRKIKSKGYWFGYGSDKVEKFINEQRRKINGLERDAAEEGQKISSKDNLKIGNELLGLSMRAEMTRTGKPV